MTLARTVPAQRLATTQPPALTLVEDRRRVARDQAEPPGLDPVATASGPGTPRSARELSRLVAGAAAGDQRCWEHLVNRFSPLVRGVARAYRLAPSDVEDVTQTTWWKLVEHVSTLRDAERLPGWLATTARRESLRTLNRGQRQIPHGDDLPEPSVAEPSVEARILRRERDVELWSAVGRLRRSDQALLRMLVAEDGSGRERSYREIADTLGVAVGTIGPTRGRALERLRDVLPDPDGLRPLAA